MLRILKNTPDSGADGWLAPRWQRGFMLGLSVLWPYIVAAFALFALHEQWWR